MQNYKKGLLALTIISAMSLMAADDKTIYVNTFDDEDGENTNKCSLREAVTAASTHKAYGGCPAGQSFATVTNVIQLEAGEYKLNKELQPNSAIIIQGKQPVDYGQKNVLTNSYPALTPLETTISGQGKVRIMNTTNLNKPSVTLNNLILKDGYSASLGGALYVAGATALNNVSILNAKAQSGGAIYLSDVGSSLTVTNGVYQANQALSGSVLAMTCSDNLVYTSRTITINTASFLNNGSANSQSTFSFCGQPTVNFSANTITQNIVNSNSGSIIQFSSNTPQGTVNLSASASLTLLSNTIVKNTAWGTLLYNSIGSKRLTNNVLAYNGTGKSCRYADGDITNVVTTTNFSLVRNALILATGNDQCELPTETLNSIQDTTTDLSGVDFSNVLSSLQEPSKYTVFMPVYFPLDRNTNTDLVDIGTSACSTLDQRGVSRIASVNSTGTNQISNTCDIGSTEVLRLTAGNLVAVNQSVVTILSSYQKEFDTFKSLIENKETNADFLPYYTQQKEMYENLIKFTKSDQKYRTAFVDPFLTNLPDEIVSSDGGREVKYLGVENYNVSVKALGTGKLDDNKQFSGNADSHLKCEWNANLKQVLVYRTDDTITPSGDLEFCSYTLTLKDSMPIKSSTAYIIVNFANIAPIANDISYKVQYGSVQKTDLSLLENSNDDGDGVVAGLENKPNKSKYYLNSAGQDLAIRIGNLPNPVAISAERTGPCPGEDRKMTCYGGKIQAQIRNTLDPFSYKFTYYVYDADGLVSNEATVTLNNSESATSSARNSGGGSLSVLSLFGILGLFGYRRLLNRKYI